MSGQSTIATLRRGEQVDGLFACVRKERLLARTGNPYLTLELRDSTGSVLARAFNDADVLAGRFERGDIVRVRGRVGSFKDELQLELTQIERAELPEQEMARFLPSTRQDVEELEGFLEHLVREIYEPGLRGLCQRLLSDRRLAAELRRAPCSLPGESSGRGAPRHHAYLGGLLEHTVAVSSMTVELCAVHARLDRDLLICAAVVHDLGKTLEFSYGAEIARTEQGRMLGHIELGLRLIGRAAPSELPERRRLALEHCVALHHGPQDGAEVRFASAEAAALYRVNALDAHVKGMLERGAGTAQAAAR
jgi:3'-5' exoribonuclease